MPKSNQKPAPFRLRGWSRPEELSRNHPGHEERMKRLQDRASKKLPLFQKG